LFPELTPNDKVPQEESTKLYKDLIFIMNKFNLSQTDIKKETEINIQDFMLNKKKDPNHGMTTKNYRVLRNWADNKLHEDKKPEIKSDPYYPPSTSIISPTSTIPLDPLSSIDVPHYVYFIGFEGEERNTEHKIGFSKNPENRKKKFQTGCPYTLKIVATILCKSKHEAVKMETALHILLETQEEK